MTSHVRRLSVLLALGLLGPALVGCASNREADDLYATNRALEERNLRLQQDLQAKENTIGMLRNRVGEADETVSQVRDRNSDLQAELRRLEENFRVLGERLNRASAGMVDPTTDRALRRIASQNPDLFTYDSQRGMLRFASDVTFASGSANVNDAATSALRQIAGVLDDAATSYDLRIVGHTDSVKPSRPETLRNHPTNVHLSVHRAIAVRDVLASAGISPARMEVAGWGPYRPAVPNNPGQQGTPQNRRVEIFLAPSSTVAPADAPQDSSGEPAQQQQPAPEPVK